MEQYQLVPASYLKRIDKILSEINKKLNPSEEWISEKDFKERTGIDTPNRLSVWRRENPELWKALKTFQRGGNTAHSGFLYNWKEYQDKFKRIK